MSNIYYQNQYNGLCRLHSLNAYFGEEKISLNKFNSYQKDYDKEYHNKFNFDVSCKLFDIVSSNQKNIVSYILKQHNIYTRYYAINEIFQKNVNEKIISILNGDFIFIYDEGHIWGARRKNHIWYSVNSIGGISVININTLLNQKNIGFIVPVYMKDEFYINVAKIKDILCNGESVTSINMIENYLIQKNKECKILDLLEIPIGICMDIIETNLSIRCKSSDNSNIFNQLEVRVNNYNTFLQQFTKGKYNDIKLILLYLPPIIYSLSNLHLN
jgi:hypothetical protein